MNSLLERKIVIDAQQQKQFETDGFFVLPNALTLSQLNDLLHIVDELYYKYKQERKLSDKDPFQMRNIVSADPIFKSLMTDEKMLSIAVDVFGYNIQLRTSHMDIRPPMKKDHKSVDLGGTKSFFPWHSDQPDFGWPSENGLIPYMEMKIGYYLTDLSDHNSGAICIARGSHRTDPWIEFKGQKIIDPDRIVEVNVSPGSALVWRTALYHCVSPNYSKHTRKCLYYGYHPRWLRPSDFDHQHSETLNNCSPVELQLLGELGSGKKNYSGDDPEVFPVSRYWRPKPEDIPLKEWANKMLEIKAQNNFAKPELSNH